MPEDNQLDDATLVSQTCVGSVTAFAQLVARYERVAMAVALRYCRDYASAEDAVQESFVIAFQKIAQLREPSRFSSWLLRITEREALRLQARKKKAVSLEIVTETLAYSNEKLLSEDMLEEDLGQLVQWLGRLPEHERNVIILHHLEGLSARQISANTGQPIGTITKQLSRAMKRLRTWANQQELTE